MVATCRVFVYNGHMMNTENNMDTTFDTFDHETAYQVWKAVSYEEVTAEQAATKFSLPVSTIEYIMKLAELQGLYSDFHKDCFGFRPSLALLDVTALEKAIADLHEYCKKNPLN